MHKSSLNSSRGTEAEQDSCARNNLSESKQSLRRGKANLEYLSTRASF